MILKRLWRGVLVLASARYLLDWSHVFGSYSGSGSGSGQASFISFHFRNIIWCNFFAQQNHTVHRLKKKKHFLCRTKPCAIETLMKFMMRYLTWVVEFFFLSLTFVINIIFLNRLLLYVNIQINKSFFSLRFVHTDTHSLATQPKSGPSLLEREPKLALLNNYTLYCNWSRYKVFNCLIIIDFHYRHSLLPQFLLWWYAMYSKLPW